MIGMWGEYSALVPYLDRTEEISGDIKQEPKAHLCKLNKSKGRVKNKVDTTNRCEVLKEVMSLKYI